MRSAVRIFLVFAVLAVAVIEIGAWLQRHRSDLPWTELDLTTPAGRYTAAKIADLGDDTPRCRALLRIAGSSSRPAPSRLLSTDCGYGDGTVPEGTAAFSPAGLVTSCSVAAALHVWERDLQVAARRLLNSEITAILHAGSFSCRRIYGRSEGAWSEHATADAIDILGFRLADGRTISVLSDWNSGGAAQAFLRAARDAGCGSFTTVLSPDYNTAHRDHLHLDTADRGAAGWRACR